MFFQNIDGIPTSPVIVLFFRSSGFPIRLIIGVTGKPVGDALHQGRALPLSGKLHRFINRFIDGDHILAGTDVYGGTYRLLHRIVNRAGLNVSLAPSNDLGALDAAFTPQTKLLWIETPGNPLLSISDLAGCAELAKRHGALLAVDNTFATPVLTRPLEFGADIVMHSATKYLGGHSDALGGALVARNLGLIAATGATTLPAEARTLTWLDASSIAVALVAASLLWAAARKLASTAPTLRELGGAP